MGINYKGNKGQTKRAVVLEEEEDCIIHTRNLANLNTGVVYTLAGFFIKKFTLFIATKGVTYTYIAVRDVKLNFGSGPLTVSGVTVKSRQYLEKHVSSW